MRWRRGRADEAMFGPYRIGPSLGAGAMGEVHEAYDTVRERTVALKRISADAQHSDLADRFRRESRIAARLDSPHVVPIHDFEVIDGRLFIDMRLVRGRTDDQSTPITIGSGFGITVLPDGRRAYLRPSSGATVWRVDLALTP